MNPVINGLVTAMSLSQMFQRMSLEREAIARQKRKDTRNEKLEDLNTELSLASNPFLEELAPGQTTREVTANADLPKEIFGTSTITGQMPIDRTLEHGGKKYAVRSRNEVAGEQFRNRMADVQAETNIRNAADLNRIFAQHKGKVELEGMRQSAADSRQVGELTARKDMNDADNRAANQRLEKELTGRKDIEGLQQRGANSRAAMGEAGANTRAAMANETRLEQTGLQRDQARTKKLESLEKEERKLVSQMEDVSIQLSATGEDGLTAGERKRAENKLEFLRSAHKSVLDQKVKYGFSRPEDVGRGAKNDPLGVRRNDPAKVR